MKTGRKISCYIPHTKSTKCIKAWKSTEMPACPMLPIKSSIGFSSISLTVFPFSIFWLVSFMLEPWWACDTGFPVSCCTRLINSSGLTWITLGDIKCTITGEWCERCCFLIFVEFLLTIRDAGFGPCNCPFLLAWEPIFLLWCTGVREFTR